MLRIMSIIGSVRRESRTKGIIAIVQSRLGALGANNTVWNLGDEPLPMMDPEIRGHVDRIRDERLLRFVHEASTADAFVLGSPVYHDSYSGVLKNALDHLGSADLKEKAFGLVSHGGQRTTQAVAHLRIVVRGFYGIAIPTQVCTEDEDLLIDGAGVVRGIKAPEIGARLDRFCTELVRYAAMCRAMHGASFALRTKHTSMPAEGESPAVQGAQI